MTQTLVAALLAIGLLASGDACAWLCGAAGDDGAAGARAEVSSHCAGAGSQEPAPDDAPSHEDCPGCALDVGANSLALDAPGGGSLFAAAALPSRLEARMARRVLQAPAPPRVDRAPPRDVLSLTTTLLL